MPLTKTTWVIAFPIWLILWGTWLFFKQKDGLRPPFLQFVVILLLGIYMLNTGYLFDGSFRLIKDYQFISGTLTGHKIVKGKTVELGNRFADSWLGYILVPLPEEFVQGIDTQKLDFERGIDSYARGVWSDHGWLWYYGYALLLKEPLGVCGLAIFALIVSCFCRGFNASILDELTVLIPLLLVFTFISSQTGFSRHPRYILLAVPFLYAFISKLATPYMFSQNKFFPSFIAILLFVSVISSLWIYPYSLSYFNEMAGKPSDWPRYLLGSNIDVGQDLYRLREWRIKHSDMQPVYITYTMFFPKEKLGFHETANVPTIPTSGWMLISVNELHQRNGKYDWLEKKKPIGMIGYSIWIFHFE